jgi:protein subunit release factor B
MPTAPSYSSDERAAAARALALVDDALLDECELEFFVAGGPGGQHRNKTETGVRLKHRPTGLVGTATERRSQLQNRLTALERLREKLARRAAPPPPPRKRTRPSRASQRRRIEGKRREGERKRERRERE